MTNTVKKSYPLDTSPDLERNSSQTHSQQPQIRRRDGKNDDNVEKGVQEGLKEYGEVGQEDLAFYQANLWWFTSTAFPLIAGTFGPIANLFSVCALVQAWRLENVHGSRVHVPDPPWLTVLKSCSLFLAIVANLILLSNFAQRIRYAIAQPLTISLWYLSCAFLVIPIGFIHLHRSPSIHPTFAYSQSFYYALISAVLYFMVSTLLLLNLIGASRFIRVYPPTFTALTYPHRTLMLQTISFSLYLALGAGVFSAIEGWNFTDGIYWADYTLLTVGLGSDFPLRTTLGRMLLIPYAAFGIILLGLVVGSVRGLVLERAKEKLAMRHLGKERDKLMDNISKMLQKKEEEKEEIAPRPRSSFLCWPYRQDKKFQRVIARAQSVHHQEQHGKWHHAEFELMRYIQITSEQSERYFALVVSFLVFLVVWIGGSLVFWACEHKRWTYPESLYFTYTTLLTIGYGDFFPISPAGKPFFVIWSLLAVPAMTVFIGNMGDTVVRAVQEKTDWMGRRAVLLGHQEEKERKRGEVKNGQAFSESGKTRVWPSTSNPALASPSFSPDRTLPVRNYPVLPLASSSGEGQESPAAPHFESSLELRNQAASNSYTYQEPQHSERVHSGCNLSQVQAEAALLAREISKLAKDVCHKTPKKYGWEEWVNWLTILGDEAIPNRRAMKLDKEVSMNLPATTANQDTRVEHLHHDTQVERPHHDDGQHHHKHHRRRYHLHSHAQFKRHHGIGRDGGEWYWTWLDDKGPLFSHQTETEWILSRLCSRLEHLMND